MSLIIIMKWCGYPIKIMEHEFFKYYVMSLYIVDYWHIECSDCENIKLENMFSVSILYNSHKTTLDPSFFKIMKLHFEACWNDRNMKMKVMIFLKVMWLHFSFFIILKKWKKYIKWLNF
jgi:hypothetical protein